MSNQTGNPRETAHGIDRREFIKRMTALGISAAVAGMLYSLNACSPGGETLTPLTPAPPRTPSPSPSPTTSPSPTPVSTSLAPPSAPTGTYLAVARGQSPHALVQAAVKALGGIERFVKPGNDVIIKPNICVAYHTYEYAATTNPEVVASIVKLCLGAGAKRVRVMDQPFGGTAESAYARSGIGDAVKAAGGQMELMNAIKFKESTIPDGRDIKSWKVYQDALDADVLINVPIAKHHNLGRLTLGMKNLMGLVQDRPSFHFNLPQRVADLTSLVRPELTIVDCVRILMNHGPSGGNLNDVKLANTVIASHDMIAADAYATTLFGLSGVDIPAIVAGVKMGLGAADMKSIKIEEIAV